MTAIQPRSGAWALIPKLPLLLLVVVAGLWIRERRHDPLLEDAARLQIEGPSFELREGTRGSWTVPWPEWPRAKGTPILVVFGLPLGSYGEPPPVELFLRSSPEGCATPPAKSTPDAQGWFLAGPECDWDYIVELAPGSACTIEYEVRRSNTDPATRAWLRVEGKNDDFLWEGMLGNQIVADLGALLAGFVLVAWLGIVLWRRLEAARAADRGASRDGPEPRP